MKKSTFMFLLFGGIIFFTKNAVCDSYSCPEGMYYEAENLAGYNTPGCLACSAGCKKCSGNDAYDCSECYDGLYLVTGLTERFKSCESCASSCKTCFGEAKKCTSCFDGFYLQDRSCLACPSGAICDGSSVVTCTRTGYIFLDGECIKEEEEETNSEKTNTVNSCPSRMTLSADGCCCINK